MPYLDISVPITEAMLTWPTDPHPRVKLRALVEEYEGLQITVTEVLLGSHTGTHVDAPCHLGAGPTVDQLPLDALIGPAQVLDLRGTAEITAGVLQAAGAGRAPRLLLRTDNSAWIRTGPIPERPAHITEDAARCLVAKGVVLVGIDGLTVDAPNSMAAHVALLRAGAVILETIDLSEAAAGDYELLCLPLRIAGADGAPARAVLKRG